MAHEEFTEDDWRRLIASIGEDPQRPGLLETPARVTKAWKHWTSGYGQDPVELLKAFEDGAEQYNELIVVRGIPVYSHCEHHLAPFFGKATIGYVPNGKIVGLSKLTRLVDCFSKRLQVQERMTMQIANALDGSAGAESGRRGRALPPPVHGKPRHPHARRRNHYLGHAGRAAAEPGDAHRVPGTGARKLIFTSDASGRRRDAAFFASIARVRPDSAPAACRPPCGTW